MSDLNQGLRDLYSGAMGQLEQALIGCDGVSGPHFISAPDGYLNTAVRLMIVGQQGRGWPDVSKGLNSLLNTYRGFDLGRKYARTPFWQASHKLDSALNPAGPARSFLWSNLVKVSQHGERPQRDIEDKVSQLGLLEAEIAITEPQALVFFTGPRYDARLAKTFPGIKRHSLSPMVDQIVHPKLPCKSFRTYHPKYLWLSNKRDALDLIVEKIREELPCGYCRPDSVQLAG